MHTITVVVNLVVPSEQLGTYIAQVNQILASIPAELQALVQNQTITSSPNA